MFHKILEASLAADLVIQDTCKNEWNKAVVKFGQIQYKVICFRPDCPGLPEGAGSICGGQRDSVSGAWCRGISDSYVPVPGHDQLCLGHKERLWDQQCIPGTVLKGNNYVNIFFLYEL